MLELHRGRCLVDLLATGPAASEECFGESVFQDSRARWKGGAGFAEGGGGGA